MLPLSLSCNFLFLINSQLFPPNLYLLSIDLYSLNLAKFRSSCLRVSSIWSLVLSTDTVTIYVKHQQYSMRDMLECTQRQVV